MTEALTEAFSCSCVGEGCPSLQEEASVSNYALGRRLGGGQEQVWSDGWWLEAGMVRRWVYQVHQVGGPQVPTLPDLWWLEAGKKSSGRNRWHDSAGQNIQVGALP